MIGWIHGKVLDKQASGKLLVDVQGVGYELEISQLCLAKIGLLPLDAVISLFVHTVVREDAFLLYGFIDKQERSLFRALIKVNGIGPKLAMSILSSMAPEDFIECILQQNSAMLVSLPGIGKKTGQRLMIELKDSLTLLATDMPPHTLGTEVLGQNEALMALESLGYKRQEAMAALKKVNNGEKTSEQLIRQALQLLAVHA